ncbi:MAG: double-cubane-cluster-containing anaerobic reductase [Candidatus Omnitrophota bacterium]
MNTDYEVMWNDLGLDIDKHNFLLDFLGNAYKDVFLNQAYRPKGMEYLDFVVSEAHGLRIKELVDAKKDGRKVIGVFCLYVPEEIIVALNGICVGLCGGADFEPESVQARLGSRNICPLIQSFMGFKLGKVCPFFEVADILVGETTCDGKKKVYESLNDIQNTYTVCMPPRCDDAGKVYFKGELLKLVAKLEEITGNKLTAENLAKGIEKVNTKRKALERLYSLRKQRNVPLSGLDTLLISQIAFYEDIDRFIAKINELCDELESTREGIKGSEHMKRIMVTGTPMAFPNWKIHHLVESTGNALVVCEEACTGTRYFEKIFASANDLEKDMEVILEHYSNIHCACFTPNEERVEDILRLVEEYKVDGVIVNNLTFCTNYAVEHAKVEKTLKEKGVSVLKIETDYSNSDAESLKIRVEAFIEMI